MKRIIKMFGLSFFCTIAVAVLLCGFVVADENTRRTGYGEFVPLARMEQVDALNFEVSLMGDDYLVTFEWLNTTAEWGQKISPYLPAVGRFGFKLASLGLTKIENYMYHS